MSLRHDRYNELRTHSFTPLEARELSRLPRSNPGRKLMIAERDERRAKFERLAVTKLEKGKWRRQDVGKKWVQNLARLYYKKGWRVQFGPKGRQQRMPKGSPNPWALYRYYEHIAGGPGGKPYVSPWEIRQIARGKTQLDRGLIFVQRAEKITKEGGVVGRTTVRRWLVEKEQAIKVARGSNRARLQAEYERLEKLL